MEGLSGSGKAFELVRIGARLEAAQSVDTHRLGDVLDLLRSEVLIGERQGLADMLMSRVRQANPSRLGDGLQASRDVDAVPEEVSALHHHVAHMHPDAEADLTALGERLIGGCECLLDLHGALNGLYDARELCQDAVSSRVGDPAPVLADEPVHDLPMSRQRPQRPDLVHPHETRVALHVGREDGRETSLDLLLVRLHTRF